MRSLLQVGTHAKPPHSRLRHSRVVWRVPPSPDTLKTCCPCGPQGTAATKQVFVVFFQAPMRKSLAPGCSRVGPRGTVQGSYMPVTTA